MEHNVVILQMLHPILHSSKENSVCRETKVLAPKRISMFLSKLMDTFCISRSDQIQVAECDFLHGDIFECTVHLPILNFISRTE